MAQRANTILDIAVDLADIDEKISELRRQYEAKWKELQALMQNPGAPLAPIGESERRKIKKVNGKAVLADPASWRKRDKSKVGSVRYDDLGRHNDPLPMKRLSPIHQKILNIMQDDPGKAWHVVDILERLDKDETTRSRLNAHMNRMHRADYIRWVTKGTYKIAPSRALREDSITSRVLEVFQGRVGENLDSESVQAEIPDLDVEVVRNAMGRLSRSGRLERVGRGTYRLPKGR